MANLRDANIFLDFTVWINDIGKIGQCPSFQPPDINIAVEEFRGGGMDVPVDIPYGIEKIECEFDMFTWDEDIWNYLGYGAGSMNVPVVFRGYMKTPNDEEKGVLIETTSLIKAIKTNKVTAGKQVEMTVSLNCNRYTHSIDGQVVTDIDVFTKKTVIGGNDRSANARSILGFSY